MRPSVCLFVCLSLHKFPCSKDKINNCFPSSTFPVLQETFPHTKPDFPPLDSAITLAARGGELPARRSHQPHPSLRSLTSFGFLVFVQILEVHITRLLFKFSLCSECFKDDQLFHLQSDENCNIAD